MIKKAFKYTSVVFLLLVLIPVIDLGYCRVMLYGAVDADDWFEYRDGTVYVKGTDTPFTGKAYQTVCGDECGLFGCYSIHWYASFKDGYRDGVVFLPMSDRSNDFFTISLFFGEYKRAFFSKGKRST